MESRYTVSQLVSFGIDEHIVRKGLNEFFEKNSNSWIAERDHTSNEFVIEIDSIPTQIINQIGKINIINTDTLDHEDLLFINDLELAYNDFNFNFSKYPQYSGTDLIKISRKHAILNTTWHYRYKKNYRLDKLFKNLRNFKISYFSNISSLSRILNRLEDAAKKNIPFEKIIGHNKKGKARSNRLITLEIETVIHFLHGQGHSCRQIAKFLEQKFFDNKRKIHKSTIQSYLPKSVRNLYGIAIYGADWYKKHFQDYILRRKTNYKFQVVEADGSRFQIPFYDEENDNVVYVKFYVIIDVYSNKIVGGSYGYTENSEMIIGAFRQLIDNHSIIPSSVVIDKSSSHIGHNFSSFMMKITERHGTLFLVHEPNEPQRKGTIEVFFKNFHSQICYQNKYYAGLGNSAKSDFHRLKKEIVNEIYSNRHKLTLLSKANELISSYIAKWNNLEFDSESPNKVFENGILLDARSISKEEFAYLFWQSETRFLDRSKITLSGVEYRIKNLDQKIIHNQSYVQVYYNPEDPEIAYLFNLENKFISEVYKKRINTYDPKHLSSEDRKEIFDVKNRNKSDKQKIQKRISLNSDYARKILSNYPQMQLNSYPSKEEESELYNQIINKSLAFQENIHVQSASMKLVTCKNN
ncbi:MAG: Mu transposase C-terminal domain-containing protein [Reichenbachiella sp.]|uniref:Mu transposase C-terminal domain-containing protein n=1 Tax=Reichenbachiella sp. TaxID=2184521 RepID=UPI0029671308|nr:Mu transposase C-terminal domain-containing protein [Reichenbachiella sp.]MDW3209515.1 Mu transposase C-terminal domain-containing protein [Reichenbachiella sp.]